MAHMNLVDSHKEAHDGIGHYPRPDEGDQNKGQLIPKGYVIFYHTILQDRIMYHTTIYSTILEAPTNLTRNRGHCHAPPPPHRHHHNHHENANYKHYYHDCDYLESQVAQNNRPPYTKVAQNWDKVAHHYGPLACFNVSTSNQQKSSESWAQADLELRTSYILVGEGGYFQARASL